MQRFNSAFVAVFLVLATSLVAWPAVAGGDEIDSTNVKDNIYMLTGPGGNVGLIVGDEANLLVDDKYEPQGSGILKAVASITDRPIDYLINTHWHGDHTGSNHVIGKTGATIVAHDNVRKLLITGSTVDLLNAVIKPQPKEGLPEITFAEKLSFHANGELINVQHYPNAHTDGDAVLFLEADNVVITGDLFFNGFYPFIDGKHGGSIKGMIDGVSKILARIDGDTIIIPGHGPLAKKTDLSAYNEMLKASVELVEPLKDQGLSVEQIIAKKPTLELDKLWGKGPFKPELWVKFVYYSL